MKIRWWEWLPFWRWRVVGEVETPNDIPEKLPRNAAVVVGTLKKPKWIAFDCACRTDHRIMIALDKMQKPSWSLLQASRLTLSPSIDYRSSAKRCHYFIRDGKTVWAGRN